MCGMASELDVAALQLNSQASLGENLALAAQLAERAARRGARLVVLPENFAFFGPEADKRRLAESAGDQAAPIAAALREIARKSSLYVVGGGFPEASGDPERPYNTLVVLGPDGGELGRYRKIHLFDVELGAGGSYS